MVPLILRTVFVATILTLIVLPALYITWFRVKEPALADFARTKLKHSQMRQQNTYKCLPQEIGQVDASRLLISSKAFR
jgi:hypothetical protein